MAGKESTKKTKSKNNGPAPDKKSKSTKEKKETKKSVKTEKKEFEELKAQIVSEQDRVLRLSADFENYKKRKQKEIDDFKKFANESVFKQLLTVVDNLERAISSSEKNAENYNGLLEGVKLTHKEIVKIFDSFNVKTIDAKDKPFDPNFHQAVTQAETDEQPDNMVLTELQKGYLLNDRLLRPSMVVVSKSTEKNNEEN